MKKKYLVGLIILILLVTALIYQNRLTGNVILQSDSAISSLRINDTEINDQKIIESLNNILSQYKYDKKINAETFELDDHDIQLSFMSEHKHYYLVVGKHTFVSGYTDDMYSVDNSDHFSIEIRQLFEEIDIN